MIERFSLLLLSAIYLLLWGCNANDGNSVESASEEFLDIGTSSRGLDSLPKTGSLPAADADSATFADSVFAVDSTESFIVPEDSALALDSLPKTDTVFDAAIDSAIYSVVDSLTDTSRIIPSECCSSILALSELKEFLKADSVKLFFRNDETGNLAYVDYNQDSPAVYEVQGDVGIYHPEISPDGKYVAYSDRFEGLSSMSRVYVRRTDSLLNPPVKLNVPGAAIPRWEVLSNGDTAILYVSNAGLNGTAEWETYSTWRVKFSNGQFGIPEQLMMGAFNGGVSEDGRLAVSGSRQFVARIYDEDEISYRDTVWYNGEQVCNVSMIKDGSKRTLFLDLAGDMGKEFVGSSYRGHQFIFEVDSLGNLQRAVRSPEPDAFDHTEWVSGDIVVGILTNYELERNRIVLVNMADSSILQVVKGNELWMPDIWFTPQK